MALASPDRPLLAPLGDSALLVRFGTELSEHANLRAVAFARQLHAGPPLPGVLEIVPSLVSVLLRYDPMLVRFGTLAGEVRLRLGAEQGSSTTSAEHLLPIRFDGDDLAEVAAALSLAPEAFVAAHNHAPLRVLATGFAPGFVYCGFHSRSLTLPRRRAVRPTVPAGTVLFAAGQTAIAATPIPTGWHVLGHTAFRNFDAGATPPTRLAAGDLIRFEVAP